jgi:hypothetical protein
MLRSALDLARYRLALMTVTLTPISMAGPTETPPVVVGSWPDR